jgi:hypothetical protein
VEDAKKIAEKLPNWEMFRMGPTAAIRQRKWRNMSI